MNANPVAVYNRNQTTMDFDFSRSQWLHPLQIGPSTLLKLSSRASTIQAVMNVLQKLERDDYNDFMQGYYEHGLQSYGEDWAYLDQITVLWAASKLLKPTSYLEIGVFRGRSMSVVASCAPECSVYGFDKWIGGYSGLENPGPDFVRSQLERVGHRGSVSLISGDSATTVPEFLSQQTDLFFDLITVDGDHTEAGARTDLENVIPRLKMGGVIIFDDVAHPNFPWLYRVWGEVVESNPSFVSLAFLEVGHGVAFALRHDDNDRLRKIRGSTTERLRQLGLLLKEGDLRAKALEESEASLRALLQARISELSNSIEYTNSLSLVLNARESELNAANEELSSLRSLLTHRERELEKLDEYNKSLMDTLNRREIEITSALEYITSLRDHIATLKE